ncbi:MAG TPA: PAS domain-containing sensor histidine kinase [Myxococcaceae bacterium]|nr:PAS domain-containing sensor histidine kinase [Myxococcaceae bacterium]
MAAAGLHPGGIADALARAAASAFGGVRAGVYYRGANGLWWGVIHGSEGSPTYWGEAPAPDGGADGAAAPWLQLGPRPAGELGTPAVAPIPLGGGVAGALAVARAKEAGPFSPEEVALLRQVAEAAAPALARSLEHGELLSETDPIRDRGAWALAFARDCPSMYFIKDEHGTYVVANQGMAGFSHRTPPDIIGKVDEALWPPEQAAFFRAIDRQIFATGKPAVTTDKFFMGDRWRVFLACKFPIFDPAGKVIGVGGHVTPIPDEKTASDALSRGEEQLNFITDALPELMAYIDIDERFRFVNRAYERWFGLSRHQIINKSLLEIFGADNYALLEPHLKEAKVTGGSKLDLRLAAADGVIRDVRMTLAIQRDFNYVPVGVVVLITDMTDQKLAEERLRFLGDVGGLLHSRLDDVAETGAPLKTIAALSVLKLADWCVVVMRNQEGKLEQLAAAHVDLEKTTLLRGLHDWLIKDEAVLHLPDVLAGERARLYGEITDEQIEAEVKDPELLMSIREVGLRSAIVVPVTTRTGTIGAIVLAAGPTRRRYDESDLTQAVELARRAALATDNTELFTQKTRAVELRDNFLATASHELRTPLTSLGLHLDALMMEAKVLSKKEPGLSRFQQSLDRAMFHSERLGGLIRQLLDVSRLREGNQLDLAREMVDLGKLVKDVTERFNEEAARASCSLEALVPQQPVVGYWDPFRLDQVATNLIGNAIKYGAGKPVKVEVSTRGDHAVLTVRDRGIGIKAEDQQRIFGKFERAVSERNYGGLGLGLWITRQALEAMGGAIRVESEPGVETTFTVELPLREPRAR